jgi:hypothetical protein
VEPKQNYNVTLKFCQTGQPERAGGYATSVDIQGQRVISDMDIAASAGGLAKAVDLTFTNIKSEHGVISIRFTNRDSAHAMIQAIQVATGKGHAKTAYARFPFVAEGK